MNKIDVFLLLICGASLGITFWYLIKLLMEERRYKQEEMIRKVIREEMKKR